MVTGRMAPNVVCCINIYLISHLNGKAHRRYRTSSGAQLISASLCTKCALRPTSPSFRNMRLLTWSHDANRRAEFRTQTVFCHMTKDIIATYRSFALPVDGDDWELGGSGQRGTQVTFAHVVEAHTVYTILYETHQHADERAQCVFASQRIILRVQDRQDSSARTVTEPRTQNKATHESSNAHNTLRVFHSHK